MEVRAPGDGELLAEVAAATRRRTPTAPCAAPTRPGPPGPPCRPPSGPRALAAYAALVDAERERLARAGAPRGGQAPRRGAGRGGPRGRGRPPLRRRGRADLDRSSCPVRRSPPAAGCARPRSGWWRPSRPGTSRWRWWSGSWRRRSRPAARWWSSRPPRRRWPPGRSATWPSAPACPPGLVSCLTGDGPLLGRGARHPPPGGQGGLHRLAPGGRADRRLGRAAPEGALAGAGRPRPARGAARRRPRRRRRGGRGAGLRQLRARPATRSTGCSCPPTWPATCSSACARASPTWSSGPWPPTAACAATAMLLDDARAHGARVEGGEEVGARAPRPGARDRGRSGGAAGGRGALHPDRGRHGGARRPPPPSPRPTAPTTAWWATSAAATCARRSRPPRRMRSRHRRDQRLAGGGALRPLRRLARLGRGLRARPPGPRGLRPLAAPARPGLASPPPRCTRRAQTSCSILGRAPASAAVADPAHHQVRVLVERALVDQHARGAQAGDHLPRASARAEDRRPEAVGAVVGQGAARPRRRRPPPGRAAGRSSPPARAPTSRAARGRRTTVGVKSAPALALAHQHLAAPAASASASAARARARAGPSGSGPTSVRSSSGSPSRSAVDRGRPGGGGNPSQTAPLHDHPLGRHAQLARVGEAAERRRRAPPRSRSAPGSTISASLPEPSAM